ncbi:MAG: family 10 glycosylhydrolase [Usitatibacter sp.]
MVLVVLAFLAACAEKPLRVPDPMVPVTPRASVAMVDEEPPSAPREFRAVWIASVANIDWPSRRDLAVAEQRAEMIAILDRAKAMNLNAIVLQVRPSMDALYSSALEPWSEYLTGEQGRAPQPWYDPLATWIEEAHRRAIEVHAWFNPYRARHTSAKGPEAPSHIANTHRGIVKSYGSFLWMDPGEPAAAQRTLDVVRDVVRRYDIDGVHIDDYFYPYPVTPPGALPGTPEIDFPDEPSWRTYVAGGGRLARADWRRRNVNQLVERMHKEVHGEKRWVRFGISPFGLPRPDRRPPGIAGFSQYDKLYADVELWVERCWLDYLSPQLYWPIAQAPQAFGVLLDYWVGANTCGRGMYPGLFTSRINETPQSWSVAEILDQVEAIRRRPGSQGHVHFSMAALSQNRSGIADALASQRYATPALIPASPWIDAEAPGAPDVAVGRGPGGGATIELTPAAGKAAARFAIWARAGGAWRFHVVPASQRRVEIAGGDGAAIDRIVISAVDRLGNESRRVGLAMPFSASEVEASIVPVARWGGTPADASKAKRHKITHITLHHQGETYPRGRDPKEYLRSLQEWSRRDKGWIDIPYHYVIDLDGRIYAGRDIEYAGDTNTEYDPIGHALVEVVGNFEEVEPNAAQLAAVVRVMSWLAVRHGVNERAIATHRDFSTQTACPGRNLYRYIENGWIRERVRENLARWQP